MRDHVESHFICLFLYLFISTYFNDVGNKFMSHAQIVVSMQLCEANRSSAYLTYYPGIYLEG
jgi:hypothetical protein